MSEPAPTPAHPPDNWTLYRQLCRLLGGGWEHGAGDSLAADDLARLVDLAERRGVLPSLASRAGERLSGAVAPFPALRRALLDNTRRNLLIMSQALRLARCLNQGGIQPLFLKGTAALLGTDGAEAGFRRQVDIDLLLPADALGRGCDLLLRDGYRCVAEPGAPVPADAAEALRAGRLHHHLPPLAREGYAATVEIHRAPLPPGVGRPEDAADWLGRATASSLRGARFLLPCAEHGILHTALGSHVGDGYRARSDLCPRSLCDHLALLSRLRTAGAEPDRALLSRRGGAAVALFDSLVRELSGLDPEPRIAPAAELRRHLQLMRAGMNSPRLAALLRRQARWRHLGHSLWHSSGKLPAYLRRRRRAAG